MVSEETSPTLPLSAVPVPAVTETDARSTFLKVNYHKDRCRSVSPIFNLALHHPEVLTCFTKTTISPVQIMLRALMTTTQWLWHPPTWTAVRNWWWVKNKVLRRIRWMFLIWENYQNPTKDTIFDAISSKWGNCAPNTTLTIVFSCEKEGVYHL